MTPASLVFLTVLFCFTLDLSATKEIAPHIPNLYSDSGIVVNLEDDHFYGRISDSDKSWVVLFYLSWCGHCIDYVTTYTSLADSLHGLSDYVKVSAINCAKKANNVICRDHGVTGYPVLMFIPLHTKNTTLATHFIDSDVSNKHNTLYEFVIGKVREGHPHSATVIERLGKVSHNSEHTKSEVKVTEANDKEDILLTKHNSSLLYYEDLIYALRYSLQMEVGGQLRIEGKSLTSLNQYVYILYKYFPNDNEQVTESLRLLHNLLTSDHPNHVTSEQWSGILQKSGVLNMTEHKEGLVRCKGSQSRYRGYPCTLWSLFHTLTVGAAASGSDGKDRNSKAYHVLLSISGYVSHFLTCTECRAHFITMSEEISGLEQKTDKDCALWLWSAHNKVNKRLAGEASEDPEHPKLQFPDRNLCPLCRSPKGLWNEDKVYEFLHSTYTDIRHRERTGVEGRHAVRSKLLPSVRSWRETAGLNRLDMSLCYLIYLSSFLVIATIFYCVVVRPKLYLRSRKSPQDKYGAALNYKPIY